MKKFISASLFFFLCFSLAQAKVPASWTVIPGAYTNSMNVTCKLNQACTDLKDANNVVAAFVGGQCRGVARSSVVVDGRWLAYLTIYSNTAGETVTLQVYNAATNTVFQGFNAITFNSNGLGGVNTPYVITDNYAPTDIALSAYQFQENTLVGTAIATVSATDNDVPNVYTFQLPAGEKDNDKYAISGNTLSANSAFDCHTDSKDTVRITVTDAANCSYTEDIILSIQDVNAAPAGLNLVMETLRDHDPDGTFVGKLTTVDKDLPDPHAYTLGACSPNANNASFVIRKDSVFTRGIVDYDLNTSFDICIRTTDQGGLYYEQTFHIPVTDVSFAPDNMQFAFRALRDRDAAGTFVGKLTTTDVDAGDTHTYTPGTCPPNAGNDSFFIRRDSVFTSSMVLYGKNTSLDLCIRTTDNDGLHYEKSFRVPVQSQNFAPSGLTFVFDSLHDQAPAGTFVGKLTTEEVNTLDTHSYTLGACSPNTDNTAFVIRNDSIFTKGTVLHDITPVFSICIRTTDNDGLYHEKSFQIPVIDSHDPEEILIDNLSLTEGNQDNHLVSRVRTVDGDPGDTFTYELASGEGDEDNPQFYVTGDALYLTSTTSYDAKNTYHFPIRSADAKGAFIERSFVLSVADDPKVSPALPSVNYISPNDDGRNDYWAIQNVEIYSNFSLRILDQFGNVMYKKENSYNNEWDGKLHVHPLPDGNYYFIFQNGKKVYKHEANYAAYGELDSMALLLNNNGAAALKLVGHADRSGSAPVNHALALKRAENLKKYLINTHQIDPDRIITESRGSSEHIEGLNDPYLFHLDRRVEVFLIRP